MLPFLSGGFAALFGPTKAAKAVTTRAKQRVRPSDPSWPGAASWAKLKDDVGGNLIEVHSLFGSCETEPDGAACLDALKNIRNPYWIGDQPAGTEVSGWLDAWTPAPSAYAVRARNAADVAAGVNFARENNLRLVVKGGGHSYLGTSNAPDSLLIWTRAMSKVTLHDAFVGKGCEGRIAPVPAVSAEAGAVWMDLYNAVTTEGGRYVQGGGCTTVGVAGLVQSGGFGSFSKGFGTAASGLLEAEIVTADGQVRIVNACTDPDLFWAIKGGGGGTFGVVTRLTLRTHDLPKFFGSAWGKIKAQSDAAFAQLIARFIGFYRENLFNPHWGEQVKFGPDNTLEISMVSQGLDKAQVGEAWHSFFDWVKASPKDFTVMSPLRSGAWDSRSWWDVGGNPSMVRDTRDGAPRNHGWWRGDQDQVGAFLHGFDSLWLPASLLQENRQKHLADALFAASRHKQVQLHINKGLAGAPPEALAAARADRDQSRGARCLCARSRSPTGRGPPIRASRAPRWIWLRPARTPMTSTWRRRNCARSFRTRAPMSRRATTSTAPGRTPIGERTIRDCGPSRRNTIRTACSSSTTVSGARTGAPTASPAFNGTGRLQSPRRSDFFSSC